MSIVGQRPGGRASTEPRDPAARSSRPVTARRPESARRPGLARRLAIATASAALALSAAAPAALAQNLTITTPYPEIVVAPGAHVSFDVDVETSVASRVALSLSGAPDTWNASIHGGGFVIDAVQTNGEEPSTVRVDLDVPADATGTTRITVVGAIGSERVELDLDVRVDAEASGDVSIVTDVPALQGPSSQTFNFNLTLSNDTAQDLTFSVNATGPTGWAIEATLTGQSQAASAIVKAGDSSGVTVSAEPPADVAAGTYDIQVVATAGERQISGSLQVEITGSYELVLSTQDGAPLNGRGSAGSASPIAFVVTNDGTAAVTNVQMTSSAPSGWEITFDQETIPTIEAGDSVTVTANVKPSGDAIAGDYNITITAAGDPSARDEVDIRYTVETSILWGLIGGALIVAVVAGVWWVFQRYGRR